MKRYIVIGKKDNIRVVRYRGPDTVFRFPDFTVIAEGHARSVADARRRFNDLNLPQ